MGDGLNLAGCAPSGAIMAMLGSWVAKDQQKRSTGLKSEDRP